MKTLALLALSAIFIAHASFAEDIELLVPRMPQIPKSKIHMPQPKKFSSDIVVINRELRKEKSEPLQWLKKDHEARGRLKNGEIDCFKQQKTQFDLAMEKEQVQASLEKGHVPRMTYNLSSNSDEKSVDITWNQPRSSGAMGGNYLIVRFSNADGKCHLNSADEIAFAAVMAVDHKINAAEYKANQGEDQGSGKEQEYHPPYAQPENEKAEPSDSAPGTLEVPALSPNRL
jgi:hypothetical protein